MKWLKQNRAAWILMAVFTLVYSAISLVNHYLIRTETLDLGLYTNAMWDYARFQFNYGECLNKYRNNLLHDHFDLYLVVFSPLSYFFRTYTLLIVQIAALVLGGLGIYRIAIKVHDDKWVASLAMLAFYAFFGIYSAVAFDYHSNVVAAMVLPWFFYALLMKKMKWAWIALIFILIGKENMSLWMLFVCIGAFIHFYRHKELRRHLVLMGFLSAVYFVVVLEVVMPSLSPKGAYVHFDYEVLGDSMSEAIVNLLKRPFHYFQYFWMSQRPEGGVSQVKLESWWFFAMSGGILLLIRPAFLLMLIPIFFQKYFNQRLSIWGINDQYSIEFAPIIIIGTLYVAKVFQGISVRRITMGVVAMMCIFMTGRSLDHSIKGPGNDKGRFYTKSHYVSKSDLSEIRKVINMVPTDAWVSGSSRLIAQMAYRDHAFRLPQINDAEYFIHCWDHSTYPLKSDDFEERVEEMKSSDQWEVIVDDGFMLLLRNKSKPQEEL